MNNAGAPDEFPSESIAAMIIGTTVGHPTLVTATVHWLQMNNWNIGEEEWTSILDGTPTEDIRYHERRRAIKILRPNSRKLLYRLSIIHQQFDRKLALNVGSIAPEIIQLGECFDELLGPWVDQLPNELYEVSPLLKGSGEANLGAELLKKIHSQVANHYIAQQPISISQLSPISIHLYQAGEYLRYAYLLIQAMLGVQTTSQAKHIAWTTVLHSPSSDWPEGLRIDEKILFRTAQIYTGVLAGRDISALETDLENLIDQAKPKNYLSVVLSYLYTGPFLESVPAIKALGKALKGVKLIREYDLLSEDDFPASFEAIIWFPAMMLEEFDQIKDFIQIITEMDASMRKNLFDVDSALEATSIIIDKVWLLEAGKPENQRDWKPILTFLDEVNEIGALHDAIPLSIAASRAKAIIHSDYLKEKDTALDVINKLGIELDRDSSYLLNYTKVNIQFFNEDYEGALNSLDQIQKITIPSFLYYQFDSLKMYAITQSKLSNWELAKLGVKKAMRFLRESPISQKFDFLELLGELGWIHWNSGKAGKTCGAMYGYITELVNYSNPLDKRYREAFIKAGHGMGWYLTIASQGHPPPKTLLGETYGPVEAGIFALRRENLGDLEPPVGYSKCLLLTQLGMFTDAIGRHRLSWEVFDRIENLPDDFESEMLRDFGKVEHASLEAIYGDLNKSLALGVQGIKASVGAKHLGKNIINLLKSTIDIQSVWQKLPQQEKISAQYMLLYIVFSPLFTHLLIAEKSQNEISKTITTLRESIHNLNELEDPDYWLKVVDYIKTLLLDDLDLSAYELLLDSFDDPNPILEVFWKLVASKKMTTKLADSLAMQAVSVEFLSKAESLSTIGVSNIGRLLHKFWKEVATYRRFSLNSPQIFCDELNQISPMGGIHSCISIIRSACRAIGISLPANFQKRFDEIERRPNLFT